MAEINDTCPKCGYGDEQTPFLGLDSETLYCDNCNHEWKIKHNEKNEFEELYTKLRSLVSDKYRIIIKDGIVLKPQVVISPDDYCKNHPWASYNGLSIEDALNRAINKFENPDIDYIDLDEFIWKANEPSIYSAEHTKLFLKN